MDSRLRGNDVKMEAGMTKENAGAMRESAGMTRKNARAMRESAGMTREIRK